jgi:hypothetical protein
MEQNNNTSQFTRLTNDNHLLPSNDRNKIFLDYSSKSDNILQERFTQQTRMSVNDKSKVISDNYYQYNQNNFPQTLFENFPQQTRLGGGRPDSSSYVPNPTSSSYPMTTGNQYNNNVSTNQFSKKQKNEQEFSRNPNSSHKNPFTLLQNSSTNNPFPDMKPINTRDINYD